MRRWIAKAIAMACLAVALTAAAYAADDGVYPDVDPNTELGQVVAKMTAAGVVSGKPEGFDPSGSLTRAEFVTMVNKVYGYSTPAETGFTDVPETHWANSFVLAAKNAGYIAGVGDGLFGPDQLVTREQFCVMLSRINNFQNLLGLKYDIKDPVSDWARQDVEAALACGLFTLASDGAFHATTPITREETVMALAPYVTETPTTPVTPPVDQKPSGGGGGGNTGNGHSDDEEEVVGYLEKMVQKFEKLELNQYTNDAQVIESANVLMSCLKDALQDHDNGTELTREHLDVEYASEIKKFRKQYGEMTSDQLNDIQSIIALLAPSYELKPVLEYFGIDINA